MFPGGTVPLLTILGVLTFPRIPLLSISATFVALDLNFNLWNTISPPLNLIFSYLTETQLSVATDSSPFSVPSYFLYPHFQSKAGCCIYVRYYHNLESSVFYHLATTSMSLSN